MVKLIVLRELLDQFTSLRFYLSLLLVIFLMGLCGIIHSVKYRTEVQKYRASLTRYEQQLSGRTIDELMTVHHLALKPPWKLAFLADGGQRLVPNAYAQVLDADWTPYFYRTHSPNFRLRPFEALDWTFIVRVVLSLVAFVFAYDAICGEKQQGTLRLAMSYPVSRWNVLVGKFLAVWGCVGVLFIVGALLSLIILTTYGGIGLSGEELRKVTICSLLTLLASALFVWVGLLVSTLMHRTTTSLVVLLLVWVGFVVVVPGASGMLAHKLKPVPTPDEVGRRIQAISDEIMQEYKGRESGWRGRRLGRVDNYAWERISAEAQNKRYARQERVRRKFLRQKLAQVEFVQMLSSISPTSLFQCASEHLIGSGLDRDRRFIERAWAFRGVLENYFRTVDQMDPESPHIFFFSGYMSNKKVDVRSIPRFQFQEIPLPQCLAQAVWGILILGLETAMTAITSYVLFLRYDVR